MRRFNPTALRQTILDMAYAGSTVHIPARCQLSKSSLSSIAHICGSTRPIRSPDRDYLVLSKGHGVMAQYACLHELGWIGDDELRVYFQDGTRLKGLCDAHVPGLEVTSGSLGHGLSVGVGLALAAKRRKTGQRVFAVIGDGEANEGSIWEALLFAAHAQLNNLVVIVDSNGLQAMGRTTEVLDLGSLVDKFAAFDFETREVDGHDEAALARVLDELLASPSPCPKAIVAETVKGRGISFMEDNNVWHYTRLTDKTYAAATGELCLGEP